MGGTDSAYAREVGSGVIAAWVSERIWCAEEICKVLVREGGSRLARLPMVSLVKDLP